jgi:protein TonB
MHPTTTPARLTRFRGPIASAVLHGVALVLVLGVLHGAVKIAPYKLPGTAKGLTQLTYFSPGSATPSTSDLPARKPDTLAATTSHASLTAPQPKPSVAAAAQPGIGSASDSGLGDGDIQIALGISFPHPRPDLSTLPKGTSGDVVLDAVIDDHGKISTLTLLHGLSPAIDSYVIATVLQHWSYTPATRNGVPIPSEQELHFHYERS